MPDSTTRSEGEAAYARVDAALGKPPASSEPLVSSLPFIGWILNGTTPSLWVLSRLMLALGIVSIVAGILLGMVGALVTWLAFRGDGTAFAVNMIISGFTFGIPAALFVFGAAVTTYLAARNDRELGSQVALGAESPATRPVNGIVPKMDLGDYEEHKNDPVK